MKAFFIIFFNTIVINSVFSQYNDTTVLFTISRGAYSDEAIFKLERNSTDYFDSYYDAYKVISSNNNYPQIWSVTPTPVVEDLSINSFPFNASFKSFKLGFKTSITDSFTLKVSNFSKIDTTIRFYLHDLTASKLINMRTDTQYRFYSTVVNNANRFRVYFAGETQYSADTLSMGLPDSLVAFKILDGTYVINSTHKAYNVKIEPGANLTIENGGSLYVKNDFIIKSDANGQGSFICNGTLTYNKPPIVQKFFEDVTLSGWYVAIPCLAQQAEVFSDADGLWYFDADMAKWIPQSTGQLFPFTGYVTKYTGTNKTLNYSGQLNNGTINHNLIRTADYGGNFGWNFVGNSYPSAIDWNLLTPADKVNINNAIYFRTLNGNVASYVNGSAVNGGSSIIPSMQAFWVQVTLGQTSGSVLFRNEHRLHATHQQYKSASSENMLRISLSNNLTSDETLIRIEQNATLLFDKDYDAFKLYAENKNIPQLYSLTPLNEELSINSLPMHNSALSLPLAYFCKSSGNLKLSFSDNSEFFNLYSASLEDVTENTITDICALNNYTFFTDSGYFKNRFILHLEPKANSIQQANCDSGQISYYNNILYISNIKSIKFSSYSVFNTLGQNVASGTLKSDSETYALTLNKGTYILCLTSKDGREALKQKFVVY